MGPKKIRGKGQKSVSAVFNWRLILSGLDSSQDLLTLSIVNIEEIEYVSSLSMIW